LKEKMASVLEALIASDMEGAKKQLETLAQTVKSDRDKGSLMALNGILASMSKGKDGTMQTWEHDKIARAATTIRKSQMADEWDIGYAEVLSNYAKLTQKKQ
jgi:hypothetical protein